MQHAIKLIAATLAVASAFGIAHAQGGGSGGAGGGAGGSGTPAAGNGTPGSGTPTSPTSGSNAGTSSSKSSTTTNTGNAADTGPGVRSSPDTSGTPMVKKAPVKHSHAKRAPMQDNSASAVGASKLAVPGN